MHAHASRPLAIGLLTRPIPHTHTHTRTANPLPHSQMVRVFLRLWFNAAVEGMELQAFIQRADGKPFRVAQAKNQDGTPYVIYLSVSVPVCLCVLCGSDGLCIHVSADTTFNTVNHSSTNHPTHTPAHKCRGWITIYSFFSKRHDCPLTAVKSGSGTTCSVHVVFAAFSAFGISVPNITWQVGGGH